MDAFLIVGLAGEHGRRWHLVRVRYGYRTDAKEFTGADMPRLLEFANIGS